MCERLARLCTTVFSKVCDSGFEEFQSFYNTEEERQAAEQQEVISATSSPPESKREACSNPRLSSCNPVGSICLAQAEAAMLGQR